ncbi:nitrogenase iron-molybdenum cofactor biosynthesis protein NifN [Aromatoleum toluvorans]|uniref:Nitrogenase iron-molybdenum cofactor biosynthesis protein NifN n=1 Tax=Aromatoleum toluvorans TaxID=92002 RepID=A0ABX1Q010_9RHOO|nr:nitrogenase iron-molybdenum cofactor biosynthesis protein NifN [Aromatoleum toluvorans]NMG43850.1 nitrogenase iron-molybdenum cofactor biosynthesis protein NifN [Aromatoleum toluvorans]
MAKVTVPKKACAVNPLKMSQPLGASYAFLGMNRCMPVMHGSQGCTSFGLVLLVRHFREAIPLQTTAMNEATTIMGGMENIEKAILNIRTRAKPDLIAICSTGLTETKGDDVVGFLKLIRQRHPELADTAIVYVSTPDYLGAFQDGWAKATTAIIETLVEPIQIRPARSRQVAVLPGCHLTPRDIEEVREIVKSFDLAPIFLPDVSGSLDGHIADAFSPTTIGGTTLDDARRLSASIATLAIGEQMRPAAAALEARAGVPYRVFDRLTGLDAMDQFLAHLADLSGTPVPEKWRRQRSQLQDAMLDGHFFFGGKKIAIGAEPDLLWALGSLVTEMGAQLHTAVTTTASPLLERLATDEVIIGDLEDLEAGARGCDLLITHSHGRQAAARLAIPFHRAGLPLFDRLGAGDVLSVGYRGTKALIFTLGNLFLAAHEHHEVGPTQWAPPEETLRAVERATLAA